MLRDGHLQVFSGVNTKFATVYHQNRANPCIIFAGHPSLRFGDVSNLIKIFDKNPKNTMVLIEPDFDFDQLMGAMPKLSMQVIYCPIDLRLTPTDAQKLIKEISPKNLVIPKKLSNFVSDLPETSEGSKTKKTEKMRIITYEHCGVVNISLKRQFVVGKMSDVLAQSLYPLKMRGVNISRVNAVLNANDGVFMLQEPSKEESRLILLGDVKVEKIVRSLEKVWTRSLERY